MTAQMGEKGRESGRGQELWSTALKACAPHFAAAQVFSGFIALLYLAPTIYMMQVYDRVLSTGGINTLLFMSGLLAVALATHSFLDGVRQRLLVRASLRLDRELGPVLVRQGFETRKAGDMRGAQVLREFDGVKATIQGQAMTAMMDLPFAPLFLLVAFMLHPWLGAMILAGAITLVILAILGERAALRSAVDDADKAPGLYASTEYSQVYGGAVRALGMREAMSKRLLNDREDLNQKSTRTTFIASRYSGRIRFLRMALQSGSLGLAAYLAINNQLSAGALIAASVLAGRCLAPFEQIVSAWRQLGQSISARRNIISVLETVARVRQHTPLPAPRGKINVEGVTVRIGESDRFALTDVSFALPEGEILGVVGPSGSGKSTLARILVGAQRPDRGIIRIDGANIDDWESDLLGQFIGYLPQEASLFSGTIAENISRFALGEDAATAIVPAAQAAGAHALIQKMPSGYDTMLGPRGEGVSAGQAQRIALARALYRSPRLLVLDEPNAHLDSEGDAALLETLKAARAEGATVIVMTHRAGILNAVDKLLVLQNGSAVRFGPRDAVLTELRQEAANQGRVVNMTGRG